MRKKKREREKEGIKKTGWEAEEGRVHPAKAKKEQAARAASAKALG